jgi:M6 family metalloprotease-like protein
VRSYGTGNPQSLQLLTDAITAADREVDFSNYDSAIVVYSGTADFDGDGTPDCTGFARGVRFGARPWKYNFSVRTNEGTITRAAGVCENASLWIVAHEFGHVLGLPDMYDAGGSRGTARYMGGWDLMAGNSRFACAGTTMRSLAGWSRLKLGFVRAAEVEVVNGGDTRTVSLDPLDATALTRGSRRLIQFNNPLDPRKSLTVEVRRPKGYDAVVPGTGVIISQVDESLGDGEGTARIIPARGEAFTNPFDGALFKAPGEPAPANATCDTSPGTSTWSSRFSANVQGVGLRIWFPTITVTARQGDTYTVQVSGRVTR